MTTNILRSTFGASVETNIYAQSLEAERHINIMLDMIRTGVLVVLEWRGNHFVVPQEQLPISRQRFSDAVPVVNTKAAEDALLEHARQKMAVWN